MSGINTSPFKPRRGKTSTMLGDKKSTLLKEGEFFVEVPDEGVGKGHSKIKIGDGVTAYSSLPYALGDTSNDNITFTDSDTSTDVNTAVTNVASGRSLGGIIASIKNALKLLGRTATQSISGLMSSADKKKLDGIESGAQKNTVTGIKGSAESAYRTGNVNITKANIGLGNVDNTADSQKVVKSATNASTADYAKNAGSSVNATNASTASYAKSSAQASKLATARTITLGGAVASTATSFNGTTNITIPVTSVKAENLTGVIGIEHLPQGALERLVVVADDTARFKLTTAQVQLGDTVKVTSTNMMYYVIDESKLSSEAGYSVYTASTATSVPWSGVTGRPVNATQSKDGFMSSVDKQKLDNIASYKVNNASTADYAIKATQDGAGQVISSTYATKGELNGHVTNISNPHKVTKAQVGLGNVDNTKDVDKKVASAQALNLMYGGRQTSANLATKGDGKIRYFLATSTMTEGKPKSDGYIVHFAWDNTGGWDGELFFGHSSNKFIQYRSQSKGVWGNWVDVYSSAFKPSKADVGLGNVDNTADADKTVKSATSAINATNASTANYSKNAGTATYASKAGNASIADNSTLWGGYTNQIGTEDNTDTWIPVVTGKNIKHTTKANIISPCVQRSGDTMAGSLNFANGTQNKVGDDVSIGDINLGGSLGVMGLNGETAIFLAKKQSTWAQNVEGAFLVYDSTDKCLSFKFQ